MIPIELSILIFVILLLVSLVVLGVWKLRRQGLELEQIRQRQSAVSRRLEAALQISQKFAEADDEQEIIALLLQLSVEVIGSRGASYVPLDDRHQPQVSQSQGELSFPALDAWVEYLATPAIRSRCKVCEDTNRLVKTCPLLKGPFSDITGMYCLPLRRGGREFGVLNLYLPQVEHLSGVERTFLQALVDQTALALESARLRQREIETLDRLRAIHQNNDLSGLLNGVLENALQALDADQALLLAEDHLYIRGNVIDVERPFLEGILKSVLASGRPVTVGDVGAISFARSEDPGSLEVPHALLCVPLRSGQEPPEGALLVGAASFHPRQLALLQAVAGQAAAMVQSARHMADLEYRLVMDERTRLAREIHDGLAQTLGFLKLQMAQMKEYVERGQLERLRSTIHASYEALAEAYQDVRQSIDGLRIHAGENSLQAWLSQTVSEFSEASGVPVDLEPVNDSLANDFLTVPAEVRAQLIRIVQEALSNVRKHANASRVWVSCRQVGGDLLLEVRDDGQGFVADAIPALERHGLQGMRERAELIGADFQITSQAGQGAVVLVRMPLVAMEQVG